MVMGNLICTGVEIKFPTDTLSYLDFPTKMLVSIKLKPGMPKDKAGIEMMFNMGKQRIYHNPKKVRSDKSVNANRTNRNFGQESEEGGGIMRTINETFDFVAEQAVEIASDYAAPASEAASDAINSSRAVSKKAYKKLSDAYDSVRESSIFR